MISWLSGLWGDGQAVVEPAGQRDTAALARIHGTSFHRGWGEDEFERMLSEPGHTHEIDPDIALGIMAATQRLGLGNSALSSLYHEPQTPAFPALAPLASALADASIDHASGLTDAYMAVAEALANDTSAVAQGLLAGCDRIVDSTNTIVELWNQGAMQA